MTSGQITMQIGVCSITSDNRGDVYPTHGMGPACQLLNIHRGDRMKYLVAMDSNPFSLPEY